MNARTGDKNSDTPTYARSKTEHASDSQHSAIGTQLFRFFSLYMPLQYATPRPLTTHCGYREPQWCGCVILEFTRNIS